MNNGIETENRVRGTENIIETSKKCEKNGQNAARYVLFALFAVYAIALFILLLVRTPFDESVSYSSLIKPVPFETIRSQLRYARYSHSGNLVRYGVKNLIGNAFLFLPMGIFLPCIFKKLRRVYKTVPIIMLAVVLVELLQLATKRGFADIDDLILNTAGAAAGYFIFWLVQNNSKTQ